MKKCLFCLAVFILTVLNAKCETPAQTPVIELNRQKFYLTRAYPADGGIINIYTAKTTPPISLKLIQLPKEKGSSFDQMSQLYRNVVKTCGNNCNISIKEDNTGITFSAKSKYGYGYTRTSWDPDGFIRLILAEKWPIKESFAQTDRTWGPHLDKIKFPALYSVRPGQKKQDESEELEQIKNLIGKPYNPQKQVSKQKNITTVNTVDDNQQRVFSLISGGNSDDATTWLKENIAHYSPLYLYALANRMVLQQQPAKDFMFWFLAANLRARADAALCKDRYVGQYATGLSMQLGDLSRSVYKEELSQVDRVTVMREVVQWDKKHPQKNNPDWMCKSGHAVQTSEAYPQTEWETRRKEFKTKYTASAFK